MYTTERLFDLLVAYWCGYVTRREYERHLRIVAWGPQGTRELREWYELRRKWEI